MLKNTYICEWNPAYNKVDAIKFVRSNLSPEYNIMSLVDAKFFVDSGRELELPVNLVNQFKTEAYRDHGLKIRAVGGLPCELLNRDMDRAVRAIRRATVRAIDDRQVKTAIELLNVMQRVIDIQV